MYIISAISKSVISLVEGISILVMYMQGCHGIFATKFHDFSMNHITKFHDLFIDIHVGWIFKNCHVAAPVHEN